MAHPISKISIIKISLYYNGDKGLEFPSKDKNYSTSIFTRAIKIDFKCQ